MTADPRSRRPRRRAAKLAAYLLLVTAGAASAEPALLPWAHHARIGRFDVNSLSPLPQDITLHLAQAEALLAASPIDRPGKVQRLYLTNGGWRFRLHAPTSGNAFAVRKAWFGGIVFNRGDGRGGLGNDAGRVRSLAGVVAHEATHANIEAHLGLVASRILPTWKAEGYADYVARESTLDDRTARRLLVEDLDDASLAYWRYRRQVAAALASGLTVGQLLGG